MTATTTIRLLAEIAGENQLSGQANRSFCP